MESLEQNAIDRFAESRWRAWRTPPQVNTIKVLLANRDHPGAAGEGPMMNQHCWRLFTLLGRKKVDLTFRFDERG